MTTRAATLLHLGVDWEATWHPTPKHSFCVTLAGEIERTTSDGETRRFGPGSIYFLDDTTGKDHYSRVTSGADGFGVGVDLIRAKVESEDDKAIVKRFTEEVTNQRNFDAFGKGNLANCPDGVIRGATPSAPQACWSFGGCSAAAGTASRRQSGLWLGKTRSQVSR